MKRSQPLRSKGIKKVNRKRKAKRQMIAFGEKANWIRTLPCMACPAGRSRPSEAAHVRSRGAGGTSKDLVPLCHEHHVEQHTLGIKTFSERYGFVLSLPEFADIFERLWQEQEQAVAR